MKKLLDFRYWSLKWKVFFIFVVLQSLMIAAIGAMFFYQSNQILQQQVIDTTQRDINVLRNNLENVFQELEEVSEYIIFNEDFNHFLTLSVEETERSEIYRLTRNLQSYVIFRLHNKSYFHSMMLRGSNGLTIETGDPLEGDENKWVDRAKDLEGGILWTDPYDMEIGWPPEDVKILSLFRIINDTNNIGTPIGDVRIRLDERKLYEFITGGTSEDERPTFLLRKNGMVMAHDEEERSGEVYQDENLIELLVNATQDTFRYEYEGEEHYVTYEEIDNFYLVSMVSEEFILGELSGILRAMRMIAAGAVLAGILVMIGFYKAILYPILELTRETKRVEKGDFRAGVKVRSHDELGELSRRFNKMVSRVSTLIDTKYKLEIQKKEAELKALQSQINPHFLYNTLDMIRWSARLEQAPQTGKSIEDLSRIFRTNLSSGKLWIPLEEEIKNVHSYLELQQRRMGDRLSFYIVKEHGTARAPVMKLIIQPLVENCIQHGFNTLHSPNKIYIRAYQAADFLHIDVIDNGKGIHVKEINTMLESEDSPPKGFAMKNIHDRLRNAYGNGYGLKAIKHSRQGAFIRIILPAETGTALFKN
ncbi:sensor histidine kinase [Alteribacillus sp. HJP-4]|uniref:cache domain-containing sensor histidine kinase n=1 Tax=Alteribacillus sp. HJP-4 TaxID=2775394 RepID=UPI0035CCDD45